MSRNSTIPIIVTGIISGITAVIAVISFATLIFTGPVADHLPEGIGIALFSTIVVMAFMALTSSYPGLIAGPQDKTSAIFAVMASMIAASMAESGGSSFTTIVAAIAVATGATGLLFLLLGIFRLGKAIRFIPYPVVGGFLAGTGWLLVHGALGVLSGVAITFETLPVLLQPDVLLKWVPGVLFAIALYLALRSMRNFLVLPGMIFGAVLVFYMFLAVTGVSAEEARTTGWLLGHFPEGSLWKPLDQYALMKVEWKLVTQNIPNIITVALLSVISLLLYASGMEIISEQDIDLNRELRSAGIANILSGMGGGMVGFHIMALSTLSHKMHASSRFTGLIAAGVVAGILFGGASTLTYCPVPILGGLLFFMGLDFLMEWVVDAWHKLPKADYLIVIIILIVVGAVGFMEGVIVGIVAGITLFVVNYSKISVIKNVFSGEHFRSNVDRSRKQRAILKETCDSILVVQLQGFIFFGTSYSLFSKIGEKVQGADQKLKFIILDFRMVNGLDSSAIIGFVRMKQVASSNGIKLIFSNVSEEILSRFETSGLPLQRNPEVELHEDLDRSMEWCENSLLAEENVQPLETDEPLRENLQVMIPAESDVDKLFEYLQKETIPAGEYVIKQGDPSDDMVFIEAGKVSVLLELPDGRTIRVRTMGSGTVIGEIGFYLWLERTASVRAEVECTIYRLNINAMTEMEYENPSIAAGFHRFMARTLCERLAETNNMLREVMIE